LLIFKEQRTEGKGVVCPEEEKAGQKVSFPSIFSQKQL